MDFSAVDRGNSDDAVLAQPLHLVGIDAAEGAEQSIGVLAEKRRAAHLDRESDSLIGQPTV